MPVSKDILDEIALTQSEYDLIVQRLGREPNSLELGLFGALWSEHCGYKHSKILLRHFPSYGKYVVVKPGEENAGVISIEPDKYIIFKMESHNHPSAIEPFQGAATGVGGIVRDIFTMGARPIALMNSLRFGQLNDLRNRYLFGGVVSGISTYGNCLGIPNIGGEIYFEDCYSENPLVNVFCLGLIDGGNIVKSKAMGEGNLLMLVGADTGRDGLHGASGLASRTFEDNRELRSTVQVGNPFMEKLLIEACLELSKTDWIVGMQDLGAAGLTSAAIESASKGQSGIEIDVQKVPRRERGMTPYEVMLSESQERMLIIVKKGYEHKVKELFDKWDLHSDIIGHVTSTDRIIIKEGEQTVADVPVKLLVDAPLYRKRVKKPVWLSNIQKMDSYNIPDLKKSQIKNTLLKLLSSPNIVSKYSVFRQYDHQVGNNTVITPGNDAAVLRIKGTNKAIALTSDGNGRYCYLNPFIGGAINVIEAARNLICVGAQPMALTNCLNFGNPERNDVYYQMRECIYGMSSACKKFKIPVVSGNVSLYNETGNKSIYPTPVVGMVGLLDNVNKYCTPDFKSKGDIIFLIGHSEPDPCALNGSEYMAYVHNIVRGNLYLDWELEKKVQSLCLSAIKCGYLNSAHDCSIGGLLVCLAESCIMGNIGAICDQIQHTSRIDATFFGESQSRILVSISPNKVNKFLKLANKYKAPVKKLGVVGGNSLNIKGYTSISLESMKMSWMKDITN